MNISDEAVEAAAKELWPGGTKEPHRLRSLRKALEAVTPHLLAAASERVGKRYAHLHQMRQEELQAQAWAEGHSAGRADPYCLDSNPYREAPHGNH